jgi:predicted dehydrogenase
MYKCAFLGCGPRARGHARGYATVERGTVVAACDMNEERLLDFCAEFDVPTRYTNLEEMVEREQPDVLHVVTLPALRVPLMTQVSDLGVPLVIVEKPIALFGEDYAELRALEGRSKTKFCVNTQLHFHQANLDLKRDVADGRIGEVRHIDVSARSTPLDQGVHVLELAHSYNQFASFVRAFGQVSGAAELDSGQPSPAMCEAVLNFENNVLCTLTCGPAAPFATEHRDNRYYHKRISAYGTRGFVQWTMGGWERLTLDGGYECGSHGYGPEDDLAQGRLTEAAFDWLEDEGTPHPTQLRRSLDEFDALLGVYVSALTHAPVELPFDPPAGLRAALAERLA